MALKIRWPLPAVLAWLGCWLVFRLASSAGLSQQLALGLASGLGVLLSLVGNSWWRRVFIAAGFPLSLALSLPTLGGAGVPAWAWLLPLGLLLLVYPLNAWRDAPLFPTPANALVELPQHAPLPEGAFVMDAGCGLGHGLSGLRSAYPDAVLYGIEWSWPLRWLCALRCRWANVRRGDMWAANWSTYDMVYLFQRPESMPRAVQKAQAELRPGAWLVSLEFEAEQLIPTAQYRAAGGKMVWLYRAPLALVSGE
jgi:hypothetical protein